MAAPNPPTTSDFEFRALVLLVALATTLFGLILWPFFGAVCWAVFIAIVFWPLHLRLLRACRGRHNLAACASLLVVLVIVILPLGLVAATIVDEAAVVVQRLRTGDLDLATEFQRAMLALPDWLRGALERIGAGNLGLVQQKLLASASESGPAITSRVFSIGQDTLDLTLGFFVMLYVLFFMFRDGDALARGIARVFPLHASHTGRLVSKFVAVVRATVKGNIVVALIQGALGGLAFVVLGVQGAVLWGAVMALLSLLPAVGAVLVWGPVAATFFINGELAQGIGLTLWGAVVIGLVDNILRPILVGKDTRLPDYLVLVATLGGLVVFGLNGFVVGPVIAALFLVSWDMLASARRPPPAPAPAPPDDA